MGQFTLFHAAIAGYNHLLLCCMGADMNRKKKINQTLKNKAKKANAKLQTSNKPKYIAKAEREVVAAEVLCEAQPYASAI
jgi:hypothetical protein